MRHIRWIRAACAFGILCAFAAESAAQTVVRRESSGNTQHRVGSSGTSRHVTSGGSIRYAERPSQVSRSATVVRRSPTVIHRRSASPYAVVHRTDGVRLLTSRRPVYGTVIYRPAPTFRTVVFGGATYYVDRDVYYAQRPNHEYVVVAPPVGAVVQHLPSEFEEVYVEGRPYYVQDDTYYEEVEVDVDIDIDDDDFEIDIDVDYDKKPRRGFRVVEPPIGAYITRLPSTCQPVVIDRVTYYRTGQAYYRPMIYGGRTVYTRVAVRY